MIRLGGTVGVPPYLRDSSRIYEAPHEDRECAILIRLRVITGTPQRQSGLDRRVNYRA